MGFSWEFFSLPFTWRLYWLSIHCFAVLIINYSVMINKYLLSKSAFKIKKWLPTHFCDKYKRILFYHSTTEKQISLTNSLKEKHNKRLTNKHLLRQLWYLFCTTITGDWYFSETDLPLLPHLSETGSLALQCATCKAKPKLV